MKDIREGIAKKLDDVFSDLDHWDCPEECGHKVCLIEWRDNLTDELLQYLHSQGVVRKVEGELPEWELKNTGSELENAIYRIARQDMLKAGYTLTVPLIEEER